MACPDCSVSSYEDVIAGQHEELAHLAEELKVNHPREVQELQPWLEKLAEACDDFFEARTDAFEQHDLPNQIQSVTQVWSNKSADLIRQSVQTLANGIADNMKQVMNGGPGLTVSAPTIGAIGLVEAEAEIVAKVTPIVRLATEKAYMEAVTQLNTSYYELFKKRLLNIKNGTVQADVPVPPPRVVPVAIAPLPPPRRSNVAQEVADHLTTFVSPPVPPSQVVQPPQPPQVVQPPPQIVQPPPHIVQSPPHIVQPPQVAQQVIQPPQQAPSAQTHHPSPVLPAVDEKKKKESLGTKIKNLFKKETKEPKQPVSPTMVHPRTSSSSAQLQPQDASQRRSMDQASVSSKGDRTSVYSVNSATHSVTPPVVPALQPSPVQLPMDMPVQPVQIAPPPVAPRRKEGMVAVLPAIPEVSPMDTAPIQPTAQTIVQPIAQATVQPSIQATVQPSVQATVQPIVQATVQPSVQASAPLSPIAPTEPITSRPASIIEPEQSVQSVQSVQPTEESGETVEGEVDEEELVKPKKFIPTGAMAALAGVMVSGGPSQLKKRPVESDIPLVVQPIAPTVPPVQPIVPEPILEIPQEDPEQEVVEEPVTPQELKPPPPVIPRKKTEPVPGVNEVKEVLEKVEKTEEVASPNMKKSIAFEDDAQVIHAAVEWLNRHQSARQVTENDLFEYVKSCIANTTSQLKDGVILLQALESASGKSAGRFAKNPKMPAQQMDNLTVLINFMDKLKISTSGVRPYDINTAVQKTGLILFTNLFKVFGVTE